MERENTLVLTFFSWWYGEALTKLFVFEKRFLTYLADMFSVKLCLKTLFAPWRRDQIDIQGLSLQERFHVWGLNASSRFVGFAVKIITLTTFLLAFIASALGSAAVILVWVIWPLAGAVLIMNGLRILMG